MEDMTLKTSEILNKFKNDELTLEQAKKLWCRKNKGTNYWYCFKHARS